MDWLFLSPQIHMSKPKSPVWWREVIRSWGWDFMNKISVLITETQRAPSTPLYAIILVKDAIYEPDSGLSPDAKSAGVLILDFSASRTVRNECLLFKPPNLWHSWYSSLNQIRYWINKRVVFISSSPTKCIQTVLLLNSENSWGRRTQPPKINGK